MEPNDWDALQFFSLALGLFSLVHGALALIMTWENTRFFVSRQRTPTPPGFTPRVQLFVPCKGVEFRLVMLNTCELGFSPPAALERERRKRRHEALCKRAGA